MTYNIHEQEESMSLIPGIEDGHIILGQTNLPKRAIDKIVSVLITLIALLVGLTNVTIWYKHKQLKQMSKLWKQVKIVIHSAFSSQTGTVTQVHGLFYVFKTAEVYRVF